jgi:hypothetical protein
MPGKDQVMWPQNLVEWLAVTIIAIILAVILLGVYTFFFGVA